LDLENYIEQPLLIKDGRSYAEQKGNIKPDSSLEITKEFLFDVDIDELL
jgi:hypothetical protein